LRAETAGAAVLLTAVLAALLWANTAPRSYNHAWQMTIAIRVGGAQVAHSLRYWVNSGLVAVFFFVFGLEARREFDMGELRQRSRVALPLSAGLAAMAVPVIIFLAFNAGHPTAHGWGAAMSTDTAFALGVLAVVGRRLPLRLRAFVLTFAVVDDLVALLVIATVYATATSLWPLVLACGLFALLLLAARLRKQRGVLCLAFAIAIWSAVSRSGIDPVVVGLGLGLITFAAPATRTDLERASDLFRLFREQPTPEFARTARAGVATAISPNERLQQLFHPWASFVVVPVFALANAGISLNPHFLTTAFTSRLTLGILFGYVVGKPCGILLGTWFATRASSRKLRAPVGWLALATGGAIAGVGFTVALLVASLAFSGRALAEAKVGILSSAVCASALGWLVANLSTLLPERARLSAVLGTAEGIIDLAVPVDPDYDHIRGPEDATVTLVEYGDFECPYCGQAEPVLRELLRSVGDLRHVWRHLPLTDVHPRAQGLAEAAEASAAQDRFWEFHDLLLQDRVAPSDQELAKHAEDLGLDLERFAQEVERHSGAGRIAEDMDSADLSGVSGTPTFFINGRRHEGAYDIATLSEAVRSARARVSSEPSSE
jgi:Na+/H+ antiporter NhaA